MSKLKKLNRLNKSKTLSVALSVGLVATNLVAVAPTYAAVPNAVHSTVSTKNSITPTSTTFDKKDPQDIVVKYTAVNGATLNRIMNGSKALDGAYYSIDADNSEVTIKADYLKTQSVGTKSLKFDFSTGVDPYLKVVVKDSSAKINVTKSTFNYKSSRDLKVKLTPNGNTFVGVKNDTTDAGLTAGTDYTVSGSYVTIKQAYMKSLSTGHNSIVFDFDAGTDPVLDLNVINSPVPAEATLSSVSAVNGTITAKLSKAADCEAKDFVVTQSIDGADATTLEPTLTMDGAVATLTVAKVDPKAADQTVVYSVSYNGGTAKTATVTVAKSDDTEKPVITLNGDATMNLKVGDTFTDPGATVTDNVDKDLVAVVSGDVVDTTKAGTYVIKYDATDKAGNKADQKTRTVTVSVATLQVSSVSGITKTSVDVKLATAPTAVPTADKFAVKVGDTVVPVTAVVAKAGTTDTFTLTVDLNGQEGKVNVNGVDSDAFDYKAPEIKTVTPVSSTQFDITYSEAVNAGLAQVKSNYGIVEAGTANVLTSEITGVEVLGADKVRVTVNASKLVKGTSYTVTVANMQDVSANKNTMTKSSSMNFVAIKDETKPTVVSAVATDANTIQVQMSEEMKTAGTAVVKKYKADGTLDTAITNSVAILSTDKTKMIVTITNAPDYMVNDAKYNVAISGGSDLEGNPIADSQNYDVAGMRDATAPTVSVKSFADNKLTLAFSEKMATANLTTAADYFVFNSATGASLNSATDYIVTKNTDNNEVYITFGAGKLAADTNYTVRIDNQSDAAITPNNLAANTTVSFKTPVAAAVTAKLTNAAAGADGKSVDLTLSGTFTQAEAENIANYSIVSSSDSTKVLAVTAAKYVSATQVTLTTAAQEQGTNNYTITVKNFANLSTVSGEYSKAFNGIDKVKPTISGVESLGLSDVDVAFSENMAADQSTGVTVGVVEKGTANIVNTSPLTTTSGHDNKVRLNFTSPLTAGKTYTITVTGAKDLATNGSDAQTIDFTAASDTTAPTITNVVSTNSATVEITFSEEVAKTGTLSATNFVLKTGTTPVNWAGGTTFTIDPTHKNKLTIVNGGGTPAALFTNGTSYTVTVVNDSNTNYLADVAGNKVDNVSYSFIGVKDTVKPTVVSAAMNPSDDTKLIVTFSEKMKSSGFNALNYVVTNANTGEPITVDNETVGTGDDANKITLTLHSSTVKGTQYRVYVSDSQGNLSDLAVTPNPVDTTQAVALFTGIDTVPVDVANATTKLTSASTLTVSFGEKLDPTSVSAADFSVDALPVTNAVVQDNGTDVVLTFTGNTDTSLNPTVKLVAGAKISDTSGNEATGTATTGTTIAGGYTDAAKPVLISQAKADAHTIVLTFSEDLADTSSLGAAATTLTVPGYTVTDADTNGVDNTLEITVAETMNIGDRPTVIVSNTSGALKDAATPANVYAGGDSVIVDEVAQPVAPTVAFVTPDVINKVKVNGTSTAMEYRVDSGSWAACSATATEITATIGQKIQVRTAATTAVQAGAATELTVAAANIGAYATAPSAVALALGSTAPVGGVTDVVIPAAGATDTTGAVTGWVTTTADKIKFTVTDSTGTSTITINGTPYTSGDDYTIAAATPLTIVITTVEAGKINAVRTFTVSVSA
jgi:Domain of unknown function.